MEPINLFSPLSKFETQALPEQYEQGVINVINELTLLSQTQYYNAKAYPNIQEVPFTLYGVEATRAATNSIVSLAGLNVKLVKADGSLDLEGVRDLIQKTFGEDRYNKAAINKFVNEGGDILSYENNTALLYNLLIYYFKLSFYERTTTKDIEIEIPDGRFWSKEEPRQHLINFIRDHYCGVSDFDEEIDDLINRMNPTKKSKSTEISEKTKIIADYPIKLKWKVWTTPEYEDGHCRIDRSMFNSAGFRFRKYKVPKNVNLIHGDDLQVEYKNGIPIELSALRSYWNYDFMLNAETYSAEQRAILLHCLTEMNRNTPFMVDQPVKIEGRGGKPRVAFITGSQLKLRDTSVNSSMVMSTIESFVSDLRLYDDLLEASKLIVPLLTQPLPTTVEAHAWFEFKPTIVVPVFRSIRGSLPLLMNEVPYMIHPEAIALSRDLHRLDIILIPYAITSNCFSRWAQYLTVFNKNSDCEVSAHRDISPTYVDRNISTYYAKMISLITGQKTWLYVYSGDGVMYDIFQQLRSGKIKVLYDRMEDEMKPYGIKFTTHIEFDHIVAPSGLPLIVGQNGPIMKSLPLTPEFILKPYEPVCTTHFRILKADMITIWGHALVSRWNGYDTQVSLGGRKTDPKSVLFAANCDQMIVPMDIPEEMTDQYAYAAVNEWQRKYNWGDKSPNLAESKWAWQQKSLNIKNGTGRKTSYAERKWQGMKYVHDLKVPTDLSSIYKVYLLSQGDKVQGFRFSQLQVDETPPSTTEVHSVMVSESSPMTPQLE